MTTGQAPSESVDWPALLAGAIDGDGLHSVFQPVVDVARGAVVGYEGLARFTDERVTRVERWFAAARRVGVAAELEASALRSALAARGDLPRNCFLSVNISPDLLGHRLVRDVWSAAGDLHGVVVELTEHSRIDRYADLQPDLDALRHAGALIAVDDVGSGYSGLAHMIELRPSMIKLDRALISGIDRDEAKRSLAEMIGTFAGRIDAWLLAEGVETQAELGAVAGLGVPLAQGFHLGRPGLPWAGLDASARDFLRQTRESAVVPTLRSRLEQPPTASSATEADALIAGSDWDLAVVVDPTGRPLVVVDGRRVPDPDATGLRMNIDTPLADAALRALTRGDGDWPAPVMCTDAAGRYVGVVRMSRIVHALARDAADRG